MLTAPPLIGRDHPGINFSRLEISGDLGGFVFVVGTIFTVVVGLPETRLFFAASLACGVLVAVALRVWGRRHA